MPRKVIEDSHPSIPVHEAVSTFLSAPENRDLAIGSRAEYEHELGRFAEWCKAEHISLEQVDAQVISRFLDYVKKVVKPRKLGQTEISSYTLSSHVRVILIFLNWCADQEDYEDYIKAKTLHRIKRPRVEETVIETFSSAQIAKLREACQKEESPHLQLRDEAILLLLLDTGIRASELCTLKIAHVDLENDEPHIKIFGKYRKWGEVGFGSETRKYLFRYARKFRLPTLEPELAAQRQIMTDRQYRRFEMELKETQVFFMNRNGEALTPNGLHRMITRLGEWANIQGVRCSPHTFRHTFASMFMRNGGDIYTLSKLLRHSSVQVTEEYLKSIRQWEARHHASSVVDELSLKKKRW